MAEAEAPSPRPRSRWRAVEKMKLSRMPVEVVKPVYGNMRMTNALCEVAVKSAMVYEGKATEL
jgi:hypothetical protein